MSGLRPLLATAGLERARLRLFSRPLETMRVPTSTTTFLLFNAFYSFYPVSSTACPEKRAKLVAGKVVGQVGQILLPMIAGIAATKADLTEWVYEQGLTALHLLLREDAEKIAGPKGKHEKERTHNHWGSTDGELSFGGRRIQVSRPRVRSKSGEEASLPHFEAFREEDPLPERVLNQILVGVSTRNYESSLDKPAAKLKSRGKQECRQPSPREADD